MTETTPIATFMAVKDHLESLPEKARFDLLARHGLPVAGVDIRIVDAEGAELPWDGSTMGELQTRGPWVSSGYYNDPRGVESFSDGWFRTGDVATIDPEGYLQIMDRTKDLVKSGGEWISSVDLENAIMAHPKVMEAAVIAVFHPKWQERPLACIAPLEQYRGDITKEEILDFLAGKSPSGGCRMISCSWKPSRKPASASSTSAFCASSSKITFCQTPIDPFCFHGTGTHYKSRWPTDLDAIRALWKEYWGSLGLSETFQDFGVSCKRYLENIVCRAARWCWVSSKESRWEPSR